MQKRYNIKWRENDIIKLRKTVKNFNAKIARVIKKNPELAKFQPKKITVKELRENITTRQDFNRNINRYRRYSRKGSEAPIQSKSGMNVSRWQKKETEIMTSIENRYKNKIKKQFPPSPEKGTMGAHKERNTEPTEINFEKRSRKSFDDLFRRLEKHLKSSYNDEQNELYKSNYLKALKNEMFDIKGAKKLYDKLSEIDADFFVENFYNDPKLQIDFIYDQEYRKKAFSALRKNWNKALYEQRILQND